MREDTAKIHGLSKSDGARIKRRDAPRESMRANRTVGHDKGVARCLLCMLQHSFFPVWAALNCEQFVHVDRGQPMVCICSNHIWG